MGTIKKLYQDQLVGGSGSAGQEVYPVTSTLGVYDDQNNQLQGVLDKVTTNLGLFTCGTAAATAAKTVSASKFVLMEGGSVKIKFTYANSADSPTLAIGSTAAKPIMFNGSAASASNSWGAGEIVEFFYDGTNWVGSSTSVSVSQNTSTGHTDITIGSTTTPVASVEEVSQLGQDLIMFESGVSDITFESGINSSKTLYVQIKQGVVNIDVTPIGGATFFGIIFYDKENNQVGEIEGFLVQNSVVHKVVTLSGDCAKIVISNSHNQNHLFFISTNTSLESRIGEVEDSLSVTIPSLCEPFSINFPGTSVSKHVRWLFRGNYQLNMTTASAAYLTLQFLKNNVVVQAINDVLVNTTKTIYVSVFEDCDAINIQNTNSVSGSIEFKSSANLGGAILNIEGAKNTIAYNKSFSTSENSHFLFVPALKGRVKVIYKNNDASTPTYASVKFYDASGNVIIQDDDNLLAADEEKSKELVLDSSSYKVELIQSSSASMTYTIEYLDSIENQLSVAMELPSAKRSINRFNKEDILRGYYIDGSSYLENESWFTTGFIPVDDLTFVQVIGYGVNGWGAWYAADGSYISIASDLNTIPSNAKYFRWCCPLTDLDTLQIGNYLSPNVYIPYGSAFEILGQKIRMNNILGYEGENLDIKALIPSVVYLRTSEEFSIWYRNMIHCSQAFENGNYSIRCEKKSGSTYSNIGTNCTYKKFNYVSNEETEFDLEIRIINTYTREVVNSKVVHFVVNDPANVNNTTPSIVLLGDSFTDGHNVCQYIYTFLTDDGIDAVAIGVNAGYGSYKDDAWAGYGIDWFYNSATGYLRSDRPLEDAVWDAGWGENEEHGWTSGQTYSDLTEEQRSHGNTKNEFYNPSTQVFDFSYYMSTYHPGVNAVDVVILNIGLNDTSWAYKTDEQLTALITKLDAMITSIHTFDNSTKIILCETTPQPKEDAVTSNMGSSWLTAPTCKNNQERWNNALIGHFDTSEYRTNKVFIAPLSSNFDTENAIYTTIIHPDKFDDTITEVITDDIHPDVIGAKYIADTIVNTVEGVVDL